MVCFLYCSCFFSNSVFQKALEIAHKNSKKVAEGNKFDTSYWKCATACANVGHKSFYIFYINRTLIYLQIIRWIQIDDESKGEVTVPSQGPGSPWLTMWRVVGVVVMLILGVWSVNTGFGYSSNAAVVR